MPPVPVFFDILRQVRPPEVLSHGDPHGLCDTDGDVDTPGEVCIQLECIEHHAHEYEPALIGVWILNDGVHGSQYPVRDHGLLKIPPQDPIESVSNRSGIKIMPLIEGLREVAVSADGPLYQLREEGYEQCKPEQVLLRPARSAVYVYDVAHGLEGVEGDPHRKHQVYEGDLPAAPKHPQESVKIRDHKIRILQHRQDPKVEQQAAEQPFPLFCLHGSLVSLLLFPAKASLIRLDIGVLRLLKGVQPAACHIGRYRCSADEEKV